MEEIRYVKVNNREVPVVISDEKEALLAAKAAGRALVGLLRPGQDPDQLLAAPYVVGSLEDLDEEFLERTARRHLGLPWKICETKRLVLRELRGEDFDEIWANQVGHGFGSVEELEAYTKHQYSFYEFGFWAVVEKESGDLAGIAGLTMAPAEGEGECSSDGKKQSPLRMRFERVWDDGEGELELGYHIFLPYRRKGYGGEACRAIVDYARAYFQIQCLSARIAPDNLPSQRLALSLGLSPSP